MSFSRKAWCSAAAVSPASTMRSRTKAAQRRTSSKRVEFRRGEMDQLPLQTDEVDAAFANLVWHHLADIDRGLMLEGWAQSQLFSSEDFMEGIQAKMMRRKPEFKGR